MTLWSITHVADDDPALRLLVAAAVVVGDRDYERALADGLGDDIISLDALRKACIDRRVGDPELQRLAVMHPDWTPQRVADEAAPPTTSGSAILVLVPPPLAEPGVPSAGAQSARTIARGRRGATA
jgi:hypothetical protein